MGCAFLKGDIFHEATSAGESNERVRAVAFGADTDGTLSRGIAVAFKSRWPDLARVFATHCEGGKMQLGDVFSWREGDLFVYALGLSSAGSKPKMSTLERSLAALLDRAERDDVQRVLLPRLGAGKVGLDWVRIKKSLTELGAKTPLNLVVFEQFIRNARPGVEAPTVS